MVLNLNRNPWFYAGLAMLVILLGLASRHYHVAIFAPLGKYPGDALWALMVYLLIATFKPALPIAKVALSALIFAFGIEFSQLYQAEWIKAIRAYPLGHLVLGSYFGVYDLVAYTVGILFGCLAEVAIDVWLSLNYPFLRSKKLVK